MTISQKIAFLYTFLVSMTIGALLFTVYFMVVDNFKKSFQERLDERALIAANIYLEKDELSHKLYAEFEKKYLTKLSDESIQIFDLANENVFIEADKRLYINEKMLDSIRMEKKLFFQEKDRHYVGIDYDDNQGEFIIVASAIDHSGNKKLDDMVYIFVVVFVISLIVVFLSSLFFAKNALQPFSKLNQQIASVLPNNLKMLTPYKDSKDEIAGLYYSFNKMIGRIEEAFEMKKKFVSHASHELKTPLTTIIGHSELSLSKPRSPEEYQETIRLILETSKKMKEMNEVLLQLSQLELTQENVGENELRIDELIWDVRDDLLKRHPNVKIEVSFSNEMPDFEKMIMNGKEELLQLAFSNLLENSIKYSSNQPVKVWIENDKNCINVLIKDQGIGIPTEDLENIFLPFFRSANSLQFNGTGVGLALTEKIIKLHQGTISVKSDVGAGTEFFISMPLK